MPPNKKGGKGYKKGKGDESEVVFIEIQKDQYMARAVRILGDRNVLCFCDDNVMRICHISRRMKGFSEKKKIEVGDIVLISLRDFTSADPKTIKRGDILGKYAPEQLRIIKNEGTHPNIFLKLEDKGVNKLDDLGLDLGDSDRLLEGDGDDAFSFDGSVEDSEKDKGETKIIDKRDKAKHGREHRVERDVNIDDI
jgi:initiation factor 1A